MLLTAFPGLLNVSSNLPTQSEATDYYNRLVVKGVTLSTLDFRKVNALVYFLKNTMGFDGSTSLWDSLDALRIPGRTEIEMRENLIKDSHHATITNNYGGSYTALEGYVGNGTNFSVNTGVNLSTTVKATQNSVCLGLLILDDKAGNDNHDIGALKTGASDGLYLYTKRSSANVYDTTGSINGAYTGSSVSRSAISSRAWYALRRPDSTGITQYYNAYYQALITGTSSSPANLSVIEFAANVNGTLSAWSSLRHCIFWVGNANVDPNKMIQVINKNYLHAHNNSNSAIHNRLHCVGDSMTGDETAANTNLSVISEYARRTQANLGNDWLVSQNGDANREVTLSTTVPSLASIMSTQILNGNNSSFTKDIVSLFIGTNDLGLNVVTVGSGLKTAIDTEIAKIIAEGKKVIVWGIPARGAFGGGQNQSNFDTAKALYRTAWLADCAVATGITNVTRNSAGTIYFVDMISDSKFANANDTTYYNVDKVHGNAAFYDWMADTYLTPICQL